MSTPYVGTCNVVHTVLMDHCSCGGTGGGSSHQRLSERGTKNSLHSGHPCEEFPARKSWQISQTALSVPTASRKFPSPPSPPPPPLSLTLYSYAAVALIHSTIPPKFCIFDKIGEGVSAAIFRMSENRSKMLPRACRQLRARTGLCTAHLLLLNRLSRAFYPCTWLSVSVWREFASNERACPLHGECREENDDLETMSLPRAFTCAWGYAEPSRSGWTTRF